MATPHTTNLTFYVAVALGWAIAVTAMVLLLSPAAQAAVHGCPVCISKTVFAALCVTSAVAGGSITFVGAALFAANERGQS
jgi:hypothetical protein